MINNIYCVGRNYREHAAELDNEVEAEPVIFSKTNTCLMAGDTIILPDFSSVIHYETELVIKICAPAYKVTAQQAQEIYQEVAIGLDLTARDLQNRLKAKQLPWFLAKSFKGAAYVSQFIPKPKDIENLRFSMQLNGAFVQDACVRHMIFSIEEIIAYLSSFVALVPDDIIFTGTPSGVGRLRRGDSMKLFLNDREFGALRVA